MTIFLIDQDAETRLVDVPDGMLQLERARYVPFGAPDRRIDTYEPSAYVLEDMTRIWSIDGLTPFFAKVKGHVYRLGPIWDVPVTLSQRQIRLYYSSVEELAWNAAKRSFPKGARFVSVERVAEDMMSYEVRLTVRAREMQEVK